VPLVAVYDPSTAAELVELARLAYRSPEDVAGSLPGLGLGDHRWFSGSSTQAFTAVGAERVYVAFRGTEGRNPVDWLTDARFNPKRAELGCRVHSGFTEALDEVWEPLLESATDPGLPVRVTGHSLGAALATLAAARLSELGRTIDAVYTFGQPRTGLGDFADAYDERLLDVTFRVVNHVDLVARVPSLFQGFRHVGRRVYFDGKGGLHVDASAWRVAFDDVPYRFTHFGRLAVGLDPHRISEYKRLTLQA
jgi:triacylglycerol lipase